MATTNPFDLLGDDDTEDPSQLIAAQQKVAPAAEPKKPPAPAAQPAKLAKLPSKPLPPSRAGEPRLSFICFLYLKFWMNDWFMIISFRDAPKCAEKLNLVMISNAFVALVSV